MLLHQLFHVLLVLLDQFVFAIPFLFHTVILSGCKAPHWEAIAFAIPSNVFALFFCLSLPPLLNQLPGTLLLCRSLKTRVGLRGGEVLEPQAGALLHRMTELVGLNDLGVTGQTEHRGWRWVLYRNPRDVRIV